MRDLVGSASVTVVTSFVSTVWERLLDINAPILENHRLVLNMVPREQGPSKNVHPEAKIQWFYDLIDWLIFCFNLLYSLDFFLASWIQIVVYAIILIYGF